MKFMTGTWKFLSYFVDKRGPIETIGRRARACEWWRRRLSLLLPNMRAETVHIGDCEDEIGTSPGEESFDLCWLLSLRHFKP